MELQFVLDARGGILFRSRGGSTWGTSQRLATLRGMLGSSPDGGRYEGVDFVATVRPMRGPAGEAFLVTIRVAEEGLTVRQRDVASLAATGATVTEIASALDISEHTVRTHLKRVYRHLGVANRVELARAL